MLHGSVYNIDTVCYTELFGYVWLGSSQIKSDMKKENCKLLIRTLILTIATIALNACSQNSPPIFYEGKAEFSFRMTPGFEIQNEPIVVDAKYLELTNPTNAYDRTSLHFESVESGEPIIISLKTEHVNQINLVSDTIYQITFEATAAFPQQLGLAITDKDGLVFLGIADWDIREYINLYKLFPVEITQTRILNDHFQEGDECWSKVTNTEYKFYKDGESLVLHQGQSGRLDNYEIELLVARVVEGYTDCADAGMNGFSFVAYRTLPPTQ